MKNEIKVGDKTFEFKFPNDLKLGTSLEDKIINGDEDSVVRHLLEWAKMCTDTNVGDKEDVWTEFEQLPGYKFKNLKIESNSVINMDTDTDVFNITFKCDEFQNLL